MSRSDRTHSVLCTQDRIGTKKGNSCWRKLRILGLLFFYASSASLLTFHADTVRLSLLCISKPKYEIAFELSDPW